MSNYHDGTLSGDIGGTFHRASRVGCSHSYTVQEIISTITVNKNVLLAQIRGEKLTDYTDPNWYYCITEDGLVFKYHSSLNDPIFYRLDLEKMVWVPDQRFVSIVYDTYLKFQEIEGFKDYFTHKAQEDCP